MVFVIAGYRAAGSAGCRVGAAVLAACLLVPVIGATAAGAQTTPDSGTTAQAVSVRDQLIANQENLLNTYRCMFGIDTPRSPAAATTPKQSPPAPPRTTRLPAQPLRAVRA